MVPDPPGWTPPLVPEVGFERRHLVVEDIGDPLQEDEGGHRAKAMSLLTVMRSQADPDNTKLGAPGVGKLSGCPEDSAKSARKRMQGRRDGVVLERDHARGRAVSMASVIRRCRGAPLAGLRPR